MKLIRAEKETRKAVVVSVDPNALNSNVMHFTIEGKTYRFVGTRKVE